MKRISVIIFFVTLVCATTTAFAQKVPKRYVAVIETQIDERSGASADINKAEVAEITNEIRREAVNNLPRSRFHIMTTETVLSMGDAVLQECADENCVISLGSKIGADYIVRGVISKFRELLTLTVEMYETEYGMLVATAAPVRTASVHELLAKTTVVCAEMYKKFLEATPVVTTPAPQPTQPTAPEKSTSPPSVADTSEPSVVANAPVAEPLKQESKRGAKEKNRGESKKGTRVGISAAFNISMDGAEVELSPDLYYPEIEDEITLIVGAGYGFGLTTSTRFSEKLSVNSGLNIVSKGSIISSESDLYDGTLTEWALFVPALLQWDVARTFALEFGLRGYIPLSLTYSFTTRPIIGEGRSVEIKDESSFGLCAKFGFNWHITPNLAYNHSLWFVVIGRYEPVSMQVSVGLTYFVYNPK